jgi:hypothetical protein
MECSALLTKRRRRDSRDERAVPHDLCRFARSHTRRVAQEAFAAVETMPA